MLLAETLEVGDQPAHAKTRLGGNLEHFGFFAIGQDVAAGHVDLGEDLVHFSQVQRTCRRQLQASADAQEQVMAQHLFELRDLFAHRALGQVQFLGSPGEAQVPGGGFEALQGGHRRHQAFGHVGLAERTQIIT
ncbi:hypothetical protein D3C75_1026330 [compost metagenome]